MKSFIGWSGGKDAALALHTVVQEGRKVDALVTSISSDTNRVSMHGVRRELLEQQAAAMGLPLYTIELPGMPAMQAYETAVRQKHQALAGAGFTHCIFGDVSLEDLKNYRQNLLAQDGLTSIFPLWQLSGREVVRQFIEAGFKAVVVCVNSAALSKEFCGRHIDESFLADLPPGVDACGENGEFHTFVFDGPIFSHPILFTPGELVFKTYAAPQVAQQDCFTAPKEEAGFFFLDLLPC